ncbi:MAG: hypothetical protein V2I48_04380 [Xanthomonadales bacterium]|nr:hypothetical protein [Xanthomonadales bacterium]
MTSQKFLGSVIVYTIVYFSFSIIFLGDAQIYALGREDGPIENLGAAMFFLAFCLFLAAYLNSPGLGNHFGRFTTSRNLFYLLLALLFLVCAGEEISWGQRIFDWETPGVLLEINAQGETNLHNITIFHYQNPDGSRKSFAGMLLNMNRLFSIFWLSFCVIVPLINRYFLSARQFFGRVGLPIAPAWLGALFLSHAVLMQFLLEYAAGISPQVYFSVNELKETNYAFMFAVFAWHELNKIRGSQTADLTGSDSSPGPA